MAFGAPGGFDGAVAVFGSASAVVGGGGVGGGGVIVVVVAVRAGGGAAGGGGEAVQFYVAGGEAGGDDGGGGVDGLREEVGGEREAADGVEHLGARGAGGWVVGGGFGERNLRGWGRAEGWGM